MTDRSKLRPDEVAASSNSGFAKLHDENSTDPISLKNRINDLYTFRNRLKSLVSKDSFVPTNDYTRFLRLKSLDSKKEDVQKSDIASSPSSPITSTTISDEESALIQEAVESMQATEFVQLFLDMYMSPIGSDIDYRLGKVVGIKTYLYNTAGYTYNDYEAYGQYDKYGRIDTTLNLRLETIIPSFGAKTGYNLFWGHLKKSTLPGVYNNLVTYNSSSHPTNRGWTDYQTFNAGTFPGYKEQYVNFFFPPYNVDNFKDTTSLSYMADHYIKTRKWNPITKRWVYEDGFDPDSVTFDTSKLLSMRKNPTYRIPAYKAINDNIMFLQHIFEQVCGVVSTYLTEWDLSIYIQEGLLSGKENKAPSYITLTNRILQDNPSNYKDTRGFVYGALNCAVSKTPIDVPVPNLSDWIPSAFPSSVYWLPYESFNRGDGLDVFYDIALDGFNGGRLTRYRTGMNRSYVMSERAYSANTYRQLKFREKIARDDAMGAAYSGWYNWDNLKYWQALYTWEDDGLSQVDIVHMTEDPAETTWNNHVDDNGDEVSGEISDIIEALYNDDDNLGYGPNQWEEEENITYEGMPAIKTTYYRRGYEGETINDGYKIEYDDGTQEQWYDSNGKKQSSASLSVSASDIKVAGVKIPNSRILKIFGKRSSYKSKAMSIANKTKTGGSNSLGSSSSGNSGTVYGGGNGGYATAASTSNSNNNPNENAALQYVSMVDADAAENGQYARPSGVSQWTPALYGGPHGRSFSPKTVEGYFETENEFFKNVPRMESTLSTQMSSNFSGVEGRYSPKGDSRASGAGLLGTEPYRSPSRCYSLMNNGYCDFTSQPVYVRIREYFWSLTANGWKDGEWYWKIGKSSSYREDGTGYLTPVSYYCIDHYPSCPHYYWNAWLEWNNWGYYSTRWGYGTSYYNTRYYWYYGYGGYSYHKDYWGQLKYCIWAKTRTGGQRYATDRHYHGWCSTYHVKVVRYGVMYYCARDFWTIYYYKRPLMHSNPNASSSSHWSINCGYRTNNVYTKWYNNHWWWNYWASYQYNMPLRYSSVQSQFSGGMNTGNANLLGGGGSRYFPTVAIAHSDKQQHYRLTFPNSPVTVHRCTAWGSCDIRTREEQNFMTYVSGNSETGWHNVYFFQSENGNAFSDRYNHGPDAVFMVPVRTNQYLIPVWEWYLRRERHRCHHDWCWHLRVAYVWSPYIEVDMNNCVQMWSGLRTSGQTGVGVWNNLNVSLRAGDKQEVYMDVPTESTGHAKLPDSPFGFSGFPVWGHGVTQIWPGMGRDSNEFSMHGWGYATTMPGMNYYEPDPNGTFENPNNYLNLQRVYGSWIKYVRVQDMVNYLPFYTLDNTAPLRYIVPNTGRCPIVQLQGVKRYTRIGWLDPGLKKMFRNLYSTSTFFKFKEQDLYTYLRPILVTNENGLRTLARIVNHQLAWTEKARQIFVENIEFAEVRKLIENTVNTTILAKSLPGSDSYDTESVYYHYWIEKAAVLFENDSNKTSILNSFDRRINAYKLFLNKVGTLITKTSYEWSFNSYELAYSAINELKNNTVNFTQYGQRDETIEEFMYAYLNVLYEYRKFYINKRCNKVDGTLYQMRELEGAIPEVTMVEQKFNPAGPGRTNTIFDTNAHQYRVSFYDIDNSNLAKVKTMLDGSTLNEDRTMLLYIKVNYVDDETAKAYLAKCKDGSVTSIDQRYIWIPKKQKYAELPFDDNYRYVSKEYNVNEAAKKYNAKAKNVNKKQLNPFMDDCVFPIKWSDWGKLDAIMAEQSASKKQLLRSQLGEKKDYPFVYYKADDWKSRLNVQKNGASIPMIKFDVQSGVDPTKLIEAQEGIASGDFSAQDIMCTVGSKIDYWVVAIPKSERPRATGYVSNLKIMSYEPEMTENQWNEATTTAAGVFGYALYPVTEEQANTIPGIGMDVAGIQSQFGNLYLENYANEIEKMNSAE